MFKSAHGTKDLVSAKKVKKKFHVCVPLKPQICHIPNGWVTFVQIYSCVVSEETVEYVGLVKRPKTPLITARNGPQNK